MRAAVAATGQAFIAIGVLIGLFVSYQLWGTGIAEARAQDRLRAELEEQLATTTSTTAAPVTAPAAPPTTEVGPPPPPAGGVLAMLKIPKIDLEKAVLEGVRTADLRQGPGHYPGTALPGQPGNAAIAGHRTTYGAPFYRLDELAAGDPIFVTTAQGAFRYEVISSEVVRPKDRQVLAPSPDDILTLTTCHPRYSASRRLIVRARLVGPAAAPSPPPVEVDPVQEIPGDDYSDGSDPEAGLLGEEGLPARPVELTITGLIFVLVVAIVEVVGRRTNRWLLRAAGLVPAAAALWQFFGELNRVMPPGF